MDMSTPTKDLFEPNILLPSQLAAALRLGSFVEGEKRLLAAVLADGVECYMKYCGAVERRARETFEDAEAWIFSDERSELFSFNTVCEILGLEPEYLRRGLVEWRRRRSETLAA